MPKHHDPRAAHQKIAAQLRTEILSGERAWGEQLPITSDLVTRFGVANQTVQRALKILKEEGLIAGRSGRGVFIRDRPMQTFDTVQTMHTSQEGKPLPWIAQAADQPKRGTCKMVDVSEAEPPAQVCKALGIQYGEKAAMRYRVRLLNDEPAELVRSYYPLELARDTALLERRRIREGSSTLLAAMGFPPKFMVDAVTTRPPTEEEFVRLQLPAEVPVTRTFRVVYSDSNRPIEVTDMVKAGHLSQLLYKVTL